MYFGQKKVKIDKVLYQHLAEIAKASGYSTTEEYIVHVLEKELVRLDVDEQDDVQRRLRGLGYIE